MKHGVKAIGLGLAVLIAPLPSGAQGRVVAPGARLEKLAGGFEFTEGPTCDAEGNLFFTDQPNDRILKWSVDGKLVTFLHPAGRANGMYFGPGGNLVACADEKTALWSIAPNGSVTVILDKYEGKHLNGPNDVWVRPDGALYFTDPFYQRSWWTYDAMPQDGEHVYFLSADRRHLVRVTHDLEKPNGIIGTPDGKSLYVADIGAGKTYRYEIAPGGELTRKTLVANHGSDGMTVDSEGNLYLTGDGVVVFDKRAGRSSRSRSPASAGRRTSASAARTGKHSSSPRAPACTGSGCG